MNGFDYQKCLDCFSIFVKNAISPETIVASYSRDYYEAQSTNVKERRGYPSYRASQGTLEESFARKLKVVQRFTSGGLVLDAGAAYGTFLRVAASSQPAYKCYGLEISHYAASEAFHQYGIKVFNGSIDAAPFPDNSFNVVVMWDIIEHLADPVSALQEVFRILKPGGYIFASTDDVNSWFIRILGKNWWGLAAPLHLCHFSKQGMQAALRRSGSFETPVFFHDPRRYGFAEIIEHFGVSYKSESLAGLGRKLKSTWFGAFGLNITRPEQFIVTARKPALP